LPEIPKSWGLKAKKRKDGKLDLVGKNAAGEEYVARTTEQEGVTERDLQILRVGSPEHSTPKEFVEFYANERRSYKRRQEQSQADAYDDAAERAVNAMLHKSESTVGYSRAYAAAFDKAFGGN
jgi:hypothetical protein